MKKIIAPFGGAFALLLPHLGTAYRHSVVKIKCVEGRGEFLLLFFAFFGQLLTDNVDAAGCLRC